ncbi:uncharacterized protein LOC141854023 [Brevipalpus obovatus]|uniref:uncharacterized protein LOC141854023 n=1 Tax=Brevipalpus obovatus TaxID=246614 RepID=UPI003D9F73E3
MWNLCRVNCPALPYEAKPNGPNWNGSGNTTIVTTQNRGDHHHLVIASQPRNYVVNRLLNSRSLIPSVSGGLLSTNPILNLPQSDLINGGQQHTVTSSSESNFDSKFSATNLQQQHHSNRPFGSLARPDNDIFGVRGSGNYLTSQRSQSEERSGEILSSKIPGIAKNSSPSTDCSQRSRSVGPVGRMSEKLEPSSKENNNNVKTNGSSTRVGATSEYRAAFNWPVGTASISSTPPAGTISGTISVNNGSSAKKSMTIADFNEIQAFKSGPNVLLQRESPPPELKPIKPNVKTEYREKFKPFSRYVYVQGQGWKKPKDVKDQETNQAVDWYEEVAERIQRANEFRTRSQYGHPVVSVEHLEEIYRETNPSSYIKDRSLAALSLATTQLRIQESKMAREGSKSSTPQRTSHLNAIISPQKDFFIRKNTVPKTNGKTSAESRKSRSVTPGGAKPVSSGPSSAPAGKIWLKPKKDEKAVEVKPSPKEPESKREKTSTSQNDKPSNLSERSSIPSIASSGEDQPKSPRPNSLIGNGLNGEVGLMKVLDEGPVKTTEIKSPEEVTGVKSPSPELWKVQVDTGANVNWTDGSENIMAGDTNNNSVKHFETLESSSGVPPVPGANQGEDAFGPLSL